MNRKAQREGYVEITSRRDRWLGRIIFAVAIVFGTVGLTAAIGVAVAVWKYNLGACS